MQGTPKPAEELDLARSCIEQMRGAQELEAVEVHWNEFLRRLERCWSKIVAHYSKSPKWTGWSSKFERSRKKDPLLTYLRHARNAEEHGVNEITSKKFGSIGINPACGNSLHIQSLTMKDGHLSIRSSQPLKIDVKPARLNLLPIVNRGQVYPLPAEHLGRQIEANNVISMAEAGLTFYVDALERAEKFFVK